VSKATFTDLARIAAHFRLGGPVADVLPYGAGLINATYLVQVGTARVNAAILQRINRRVFPTPARIMDNLRVLEDHVRSRQGGSEAERHTLHLPRLLSTRDGHDYVVDSTGEVWRALGFVENTRTLSRIERPEQATEVGRALGWFHRLTRDLTPDRLVDTLPGFHFTPGYLRRLEQILESSGNTPDRPEMRFCVDFVDRRRGLAGLLVDAKRKGLIADRVMHGDPKLDNILFERDSNRAMSLIDLDTVKPGLVQYDIADCLRSCCNRAGETPDQREPTEFDPDIFRSILEGYAEETRGVVTPNDFACFYPAIRLMPLELGIRFLTDYLEGNRYFKVEFPDENLHKAVIQFRLTESIERQERRLRRSIEELTR
jgi:Ser/Thr protein kinase RdoA (MazF antagonist)